MRPLEDIIKDLSAAAKDIETKQATKNRLDKEQSDAAVALDDARTKALSLKNEMQEFMDLLVPGGSSNGRVRQ